MSYGVDTRAALRWAVLTLALAAAVGLSAYWTALASRSAEAPPAAAPRPQPVPGLLPINPAARHREPSTALDRAFRRGRRAGFREGKRAAARSSRRGAFARWDPGAAYLVTTRPDGKGIATRMPIEPGASYELCKNRRAVCVRRKPD